MLDIGEPWPIFLEGMEECYKLKPLVSKGLSHSVNLGLAFLAKYRLKLSCYENGTNPGADSRQQGISNYISGWRMFRFREPEVGEDLESNKGTRDLNSSLENSPGEDNHQCIKGWS